MGLSWDKALPSLESLKECCRVLKPGAFGFFMCAPRQDVLSRMIIRLEDAGFNVNLSSIYWTYASGFPKSQNISKAIDRKCKAKREVIGIKRNPFTITGRSESSDYGDYGLQEDETGYRITEITAPATEAAKQFDGAYTMNLKPALEVIIVVMKPLSEKTYVDQALTNGHGVTWLNDCRIPYKDDNDKGDINRFINISRSKERVFGKGGIEGDGGMFDPGRPGDIVDREGGGRFPANLLVSDDCLNNGIITKPSGRPNCKNKVYKSGLGEENGGIYGKYNDVGFSGLYNDSGSFSRYFDLDAWFASKLPDHVQKTYPCLIVPKPAKSEKNKYIENKHPTVKPLKLMSYLITMGSREGDLILDPFAGSGTTLEACTLLNRWFVGIDIDEENRSLMEARGQLNTINSKYIPKTLDAFTLVL